MDESVSPLSKCLDSGPGLHWDKCGLGLRIQSRSYRLDMKVAQSCLTLNSPWNSPGQNTEVGSCSFLRGIFPTQGLNLGLLHCRRILYQLSHQGSPHRLDEHIQTEPPCHPTSLSIHFPSITLSQLYHRVAICPQASRFPFLNLVSSSVKWGCWLLHSQGGDGG